MLARPASAIVTTHRLSRGAIAVLDALRTRAACCTVRRRCKTAAITVGNATLAVIGVQVTNRFARWALSGRRTLAAQAIAAVRSIGVGAIRVGLARGFDAFVIVASQPRLARRAGWNANCCTIGFRNAADVWILLGATWRNAHGCKPKHEQHRPSRARPQHCNPPRPQPIWINHSGAA